MSRLTREAARIANAISPGNAAGRSLRRFAYNPDGNEQLHQDPTNDELSPSSTQQASTSNGGTLGKRKRQSTSTPTKKSAVKVEATEIRRSPRKAPKTATNDDEEEEEEDEVGRDGTPKRKAKRQPAKRIKGTSGEVIRVEPPANWEEVYNTTAEQRKRVLAPVDTMGCESLAEEHRSPKDQRLQTLVSLMLSSQTKDTVTAAAMRNLQQNLPGGFCLDSLLKVPPADLNRLIEKVGFHNNKTKYIKSTATILQESFAGDIPSTIDGLVSLPGVGPKMAYLCMSAAWGRDEGIGVDVHVHRITNLWGWHKTSTPEQTRAELEAWLPREKWHDINHLLVGFGQTVCLPVGRRCGECDLGMKGICPSAVAGSPRKRKVKQEIAVKGEDDGDVGVKEEAVVETDDKGATVHIKSEDVGDVQAQVPDIEGIGAGSIRRLSESAQAG